MKNMDHVTWSFNLSVNSVFIRFSLYWSKSFANEGNDFRGRRTIIQRHGSSENDETGNKLNKWSQITAGE